jgi:hypothetical protein
VAGVLSVWAKVSASVLRTALESEGAVWVSVDVGSESVDVEWLMEPVSDPRKEPGPYSRVACSTPR